MGCLSRARSDVFWGSATVLIDTGLLRWRVPKAGMAGGAAGTGVGRTARLSDGEAQECEELEDTQRTTNDARSGGAPEP
jgi:hypothetical protein